MKKISVLLFASVLLLASCMNNSEPNSSSPSNNDPSTPTEEDETPKDEGKKEVDPLVDFNIKKRVYDELEDEYRYNTESVSFKKELKDNYKRIAPNYYLDNYINKLEEPSLNVKDISEIFDIINYMAFYHIESKTFTFHPSYSLLGTTAEKEIRKAFWNSCMAVNTCGLEISSSGDNHTIKLLYPSIPNSVYSVYDYQFAINPYETYNPTSNFIELGALPTGTVDVYNSDQLLYILNGCYLDTPNILANSPASTVYSKAKEILESVITTSMNETQKMYVVHEYLINHTVYDVKGEELSSSYFEEEEKYPSKIASSMVSNYSEGPLLYGIGTSVGLMKAELLLLSLLNINDIYPVTSAMLVSLDETINAKSEEYGYGYHSFLYYMSSSDKLYICDPSYSYSDAKTFTYDTSKYVHLIRNDALLMLRSDWEKYMGDYEDIYNVYYLAMMASTSERIRYSSEIRIASSYAPECTNLSSFLDRYELAKAAAEAYKENHTYEGEKLYRFQFTFTGNDEDDYQAILDKVEELVLDEEIVNRSYKNFARANATGITIYYAH